MLIRDMNSERLPAGKQGASQQIFNSSKEVCNIIIKTKKYSHEK